MKVAFITSTFPSPDKPALGIFNLRAAKALSAHCDLTVYKLRMWKPGRPRCTEMMYEGLRVKTYALPLLPFHGVWSYVVSSYITSFALRGEIRRDGFDMLFSSGINYGGLLSSMIAPYAKAKHVAQAIGSDVNFDLPKLVRWGFGRVYNKGAHGIISVSHDIDRRVRAVLPRITNTTVAYRGIDIVSYQPAPWDDSPGTRFLFLGGFPKGIGDDGINLKGGITVTNIWKKHEADYTSKGYTLTIGGVNADTQWLHEWKKSLAHPDRVTLVGTVKAERAKALIEESHVVLLPSLGEGLPNIAVEASALGRVVFGSNVNGVPEIVLDRKTGIILPPKDEEAWANAVLTLGDQKEELKKMGLAAREHVCAHFDSRNFAPAVMQFLNTTLAHSQTARTDRL